MQPGRVTKVIGYLATRPIQAKTAITRNRQEAQWIPQLPA